MEHLPSIPAQAHARAPILVVVSRRINKSVQERIVTGIEGSLDHNGLAFDANEFMLLPPHGPEQAALERRQLDGCVEDLYNLSQRAGNAGWDEVIVLDALSIRQITGRTRPDEGFKVSAVFLSSCLKMVAEGKPAHIKRTSFQSAIIAALAKDDSQSTRFNTDAETGIMQLPILTKLDGRSLPLASISSTFRHGGALHDPSQPLFAEHFGRMGSTHTLDVALAKLPETLRDHVINLAEQSMTINDCAPYAPNLEPSPYSLPLMSISPLTGAEDIRYHSQAQRELRNILNKAPGNRPWKVDLSPWLGPRKASRKQLWQLLLARSESLDEHRAFMFFDADIWRKARRIIVVALPKLLGRDFKLPVAKLCNVGACSKIHRESCRRMRNTRQQVIDIFRVPKANSDDHEVLFNPAARFNNETSLPHGLRDVAETPLVISLSSQVMRSAFAALYEAGVFAFGGVEQEILFVPHETVDEGNVLDVPFIWESLENYRLYGSGPQPKLPSGSAICLDGHYEKFGKPLYVFGLAGGDPLYARLQGRYIGRLDNPTAIAEELKREGHSVHHVNEGLA